MDDSVVFTLLPQDTAADGSRKAAVFVAPHLTPDAPETAASNSPAFADWPAVVAASRVIVQKRGGGTIEVNADTSALNSDLWRTYLAPITVDGWTFRNLAGTELRSFPAQSILAFARGLYHAVAAASGGDHPDTLAGPLRSLGAAYRELTGDWPVQEPGGREAWNATRRAEEHARRQRTIDQRVDRALTDRKAATGPAAATTTSAVTPDAAIAAIGSAVLNLAEARRFYDRPESRDEQAATFPIPDPRFEPPQVHNDIPDFHAVLGALGDHPALMRAFGIVIPIRIDAGFVAGGGDLRVWLEHDLLTANPVTAQPWTRTVVDGAHFQAVSESGDMAGGMLALEDADRFDVSQVDTDSTALLLEQRVANQDAIREATLDGASTADLPGLRSTGLTVTRLGRADILTSRIDRSAANAAAIAAGGDVVFFAEDIVRGYRVEVYDGVQWRSLMHRHVDYTDVKGGKPVLDAEDEAYIKASTITQDPTAPAPPAYLHEAVFGWDGWSLAVPRPGAHLPLHPPAPGSSPVTSGPGEPFPGQLRLLWDARLIPGTLPRLRYGGQYRLRARTVDLAGASTELAGDEHATSLATFRRFQPVGHPVVVQRRAVTEGESSLRMVIRSGVDGDPLNPLVALAPIDPTTYAKTLNATAPRIYATFTPDCQRHLFPPKTSEAEAELDGRFDGDGIGATAANANPRRAYARARREEGRLIDGTVGSADDPAASTATPWVHLVPPLAEDGPVTPAREAALTAELDDMLAKARTDRLSPPAAGYAVVHDVDQAQVPYLPDSMATGIGLRFTGDGSAAGWKDAVALPFQGNWPDQLPYRIVLEAGDAPAVIVAGQVVTVQLPPGGTARVRCSSTVDARGLDAHGMWEWISDTVAQSDVQNMLNGGHQMITPEESLTLVHATQRPLARPSLRSDLRAVRDYGDTDTRLRGRLNVDWPTMSRVDVQAVWNEWFDDPASNEPPTYVTGRTAHAFSIVVPSGPTGFDLTEASTGAQFEASPRHELHDTIHRKITYRPSATTRFREYLPSSIANDPGALGVTGAGLAVHVPCTARTRAPVIHSVIPTFRWHDLGEDRYEPEVRSRQRLGGLRVWLHRPWYTSGEGELLGVVLTGSDGIFADTDLRRQYTTLWGKDPIRRSGALTAPVPRPRDFRGGDLVVRERLTLAEFGATPPGLHPGVTVVGHPVTYSPERNLWYADLDIDAGEASWPFIRLAVARFQPWAVDGAELSPVAIADFIQLVNDRTVSLLRGDSDTITVTVTGIADWLPGPEMLPPNTIDFPPRLGDLKRGVRVWVERRGPLNSDLDWTPEGEFWELDRVDEEEVARTWSRTVRLPVPLPPNRPGIDQDGSGSEYRIVIAEWESLPFDDPFVPAGPIERIVYVDRFPL